MTVPFGIQLLQTECSIGRPFKASDGLPIQTSQPATPATFKVSPLEAHAQLYGILRLSIMIHLESCTHSMEGPLKIIPSGTGTCSSQEPPTGFTAVATDGSG